MQTKLSNLSPTKLLNKGRHVVNEDACPIGSKDYHNCLGMYIHTGRTTCLPEVSLEMMLLLK